MDATRNSRSTILKHAQKRSICSTFRSIQWDDIDIVFRQCAQLGIRLICSLDSEPVPNAGEGALSSSGGWHGREGPRRV